LGDFKISLSLQLTGKGKSKSKSSAFIIHSLLSNLGMLLSMRPPGVDDEVEVEQVQASAVWPGAGVKPSMNIN